MASVVLEDARDLELKRELEQAFQDYLRAPEPIKAALKAAYLTKLRAFTDSVVPGGPGAA
jgi:hypothetical protein